MIKNYNTKIFSKYFSALIMLVIVVVKNSYALPYKPTASEGKLVLSPKAYRLYQPSVDYDTASAILAQTSWFARVMTDAMDVWPPSFVSSRFAGESYSSTQVPYDFNSKTMAHRSLYRYTVGALGDSNNAISNQEPVNYNTAIRDWVEFHITRYCDPLAASIGPVGINNCHATQKAIYENTSLMAQKKQQGITPWDLVTTDSTGATVAGPYAGDLRADNFFNSKHNDPEAAMRYVYNVTEAMPPTFVPDLPQYSVPDSMLTVYNNNVLLKDEGYSKYVRFMEQQSKLSLSQYALMKMFADRLPIPQTTIPVDSWDATGKKTTSYEPTSRYGLLEFEATKRMKDPAWFDRLRQMPTEALLKEIAMMSSTQLTLDFKRYEQQQMQTALMASFSSDMVKLVKTMREMQDQMKAAQSGANLGGNPFGGIQNIINQYQVN